MISLFISSTQKIIPEKIWNPLVRFLINISDFSFRFYSPYFSFVRWRYKRIVKKLQHKETLKVVFFLIHDSVWKYEGLYRLMEQDERFEPIVVVCPYILHGEEVMKRDMEQAYKAFLYGGYNVIKSLDDVTHTWLDVKQELKPDIVFFSNPHKITRREYYIMNYLTCLTCYVPYGFMIANIQDLQFNQLFHNLIWSCFYETPVHIEMTLKYAANKGNNVSVYGYPMCDVFLNKTYVPKDVWKVKDGTIKRIIWAPHHTIEDNAKELAYSNFLSDSQFMFDIIKLYPNKIQIAFKPHPILKAKLYEHKDWGKRRTDDYYLAWKNCEFGQLEEGVYEDLFMTSDAMILDSISFIAEYLYLNKPIIFAVRDKTIDAKFNEFGQMAFKMMYKANNQKDLLNFIEETVFNNHDELYAERKVFVKKLLIPPNNISASENIMCHIKKELLHEVHI